MVAVPEQDTFNNEDLFNIYERDNSCSFELCSPLAAETPMNPFSTSQTTSSSSSHSSYPKHSTSSTSSQHPSDDVFKKPGKPVSAQRSSGPSIPEVRQVHSTTYLDPDTASKLSSFSDRLSSRPPPPCPALPSNPPPRAAW